MCRTGPCNDPTMRRASVKPVQASEVNRIQCSGSTPAGGSISLTSRATPQFGPNPPATRWARQGPLKQTPTCCSSCTRARRAPPLPDETAIQSRPSPSTTACAIELVPEPSGHHRHKRRFWAGANHEIRTPLLLATLNRLIKIGLPIRHIRPSAAGRQVRSPSLTPRLSPFRWELRLLRHIREVRVSPRRPARLHSTFLLAQQAHHSHRFRLLLQIP